MNKKTIEIQKQLEVSMAFVKAADEAKAEQSEREKRIREQAEKAAEDRRRKKAEREAYEEWRRNNPPTEEEKEQRRQEFRELLNRAKGGDNNDKG